MRIIVTGGTGFIGRALVNELLENGHNVTILSRNAGSARALLPSSAACINWNPSSPGTCSEVFADADAVINLAGAPIAEGRWTESRKRLIWDSRVSATRAVVEALRSHATKPCVLLNASGIGYYGASDDRLLDEGAARGTGFLADLCLAWEGEAMSAAEFGTRVVIVRTGMVLEADGGALAKMLLPFRLFAGGPIIPGTQWVSWIHRRDHIGIIQWALVNDGVSGPLNSVAPEPVTMKTFCEVLGRVIHRPSWLPVPRIALNVLLGELGTILTTGQRVIPTKAKAEGYTFQYPKLEPALQAILIGAEDALKAA
ncbi:MAG TPA: TIGR01777 family oxidoreductase [Nitrospira sp.]|nr:TIGR01777 family oxidoreductase [Nitrospira sp.]